MRMHDRFCTMVRMQVTGIRQVLTAGAFILHVATVVPAVTPEALADAREEDIGGAVAVHVVACANTC